MMSGAHHGHRIFCALALPLASVVEKQQLVPSPGPKHLFVVVGVDVVILAAGFFLARFGAMALAHLSIVLLYGLRYLPIKLFKQLRQQHQTCNA